LSRYENTNIRKKLLSNNKNKVHSYGTTIYEKVHENNNDIYVIAQEGDRLDNIAFQYYGDSKLWWYIATANKINTINIPPGTSLRIPSSTQFAKGK
tara:strand:+ start:717 stop:1004 length:288 start_codon:yes stop_codon:yes gene_type:complete